MNLRIERLSWDAYERFLAEPGCAPASLYHHPRWLKAVEEGLRMPVALLGLHDEHDMIGVLPGFLVRQGPVRLFGSPLRGSMTPYLGWLCRDGRQPDTAAVLDRIYRFCRRALACRYVEIGLADPQADRAGREPPPGWHIEHPETYVVDLRPGEAAAWKNLGQKGRQKVNKAQRSGVVIEPVAADRRLMDDFYAMLETSFGRHHIVSPHPKSFYLALHDHLISNGRMAMLAATYQGRPIAIGMFMSNDREIHFVSGASITEHLDLRPNNLLHWHVMSQAIQRGLGLYDLGGKGTPSIDQFKESLGSSVQQYTFFWRATPLVTLARAAALRALPTLLTWRYQARRLIRRPSER